jgi:hypothetical protein
MAEILTNFTAPSDLGRGSVLPRQEIASPEWHEKTRVRAARGSSYWRVPAAQGANAARNRFLRMATLLPIRESSQWLPW